MKKFLLALLAIVCVNSVYAVVTEEAPWVYDLERLTATRRSVGADQIEVRAITVNMDSFGSPAARSVNSLKALLPGDAQVGQWYQVERMGLLTVEGATARQPFSVCYYLQFLETITTDNHAHYGTGISTPSGLNNVVTRFPVHECTQTTTTRQILAKLVSAAASASEDAEPTSFVLATETIVGDHVAGTQVMHAGSPWMPTNPGEQTYVSGLITPDPRGVGEPTGDARGSMSQAGKNIESAFCDVRDSAAVKAVESAGRKLGKALGLRRKK